MHKHLPPALRGRDVSTATFHYSLLAGRGKYKKAKDVHIVNGRAFRLIKDKEIIGNMIAKSRYHKNVAIERRTGADERMKQRTSMALRFVLR